MSDDTGGSHDFGSFFPQKDSNTSEPKISVGVAFGEELKEAYTDIFAFDEKRRDEAIYRYNILDALVDIHGPNMTKKNIMQSKVFLEEKFGQNVPSSSSIWRYWKSFKESEFKLSSLIPDVTKGNRSQRVPVEAEEYIESAIRSFFSEESPTIQQAYIVLETEIDRHNECHDTKLKTPLSLEGFRKRIVKTPDYDKLLIKKGKKAADAFYNKVGQRPETTRVLQRVEADHTRLDLFVIDEARSIPLGRPWLTLLFDTHTKSVVGFYLGFEPPSYLSVSLALENAILPKDYVRELYPEVQNTWPCYGIPEHLVVDNGAEFNSKDFVTACKTLHIKVKKNPVKKPWLKGAVERYFRTINNKLLSGIPGKSFTNIFARGDYDPQKNAIITHNQLMKIIHVWLIDVYQSSPNCLETNIPNLAWSESIKSAIPPRPFKGTSDELRFNLGKNAEVSLNKNGIQFKKTLRYSSRTLALYFGKHSFKGKSIKVRIKYDPTNMGKIYVLDMDKNEFFAVESVNPDYAYSVSEWLHKVCCDFARSHIRKNYVHKDVVKAWRVIFDTIYDAFHSRSEKKSNLGIRDASKSKRVLEHAMRTKSDVQPQENLLDEDEIDWGVEVNTDGWKIDSVQGEVK
ncbi:Mu transposase C-terminal domain-containing protein [Enterovibrio paralichthyis]|uniref:Mu transposase C-terminal domain-containing protein n=1 Tax=Enterovibrio paralichthyis TaxID=2853805 RepID=UPI001C48A24F|nr:Mu transposase C-terminal domain-containing protein [Enterovibrio paralichthyis]MBV7297704.1 Mu transposase C-terminal domain-containing protein [Enterovibrio paralichthyis]